MVEQKKGGFEVGGGVGGGVMGIVEGGGSRGVAEAKLRLSCLPPSYYYLPHPKQLPSFWFTLAFTRNTKQIHIYNQLGFE